MSHPRISSNYTLVLIIILIVGAIRQIKFNFICYTMFTTYTFKNFTSNIMIVKTNKFNQNCIGNIKLYKNFFYGKDLIIIN